MSRQSNLVPNAPYRERYEWLRAHQLGFEAHVVCLQLVAAGFHSFYREYTERRRSGGSDVGYLHRTLGINPQQPTSKPGRRYPGGYRTHIPADLADALYDALDMHPSLEDRMPDPPRFHDHRSRYCAYGRGLCRQAPGHGRFGAFCATHAAELGELRARCFKANGALKREHWPGPKEMEVAA